MERRAWVLAAENGSVRRARRLVAGALDGLRDAPLDVVLVLTSELVTNAVRHGDGPITLRLSWGGRRVLVEVRDASPQRPVVRALDREAPGGRGLLLVDALSDDWGVRSDATGKSVWFTCQG